MTKNIQYNLQNRKTLESNESKTLAPYAQQSRNTHQTRKHKEPEHSYRTAFQRDRDRIIHSRAFRRLKHKRQVFLPEESDHNRTRITHTLEVAQLSRTMARALGLNEDLTEAIALGHDIGHTPFGHLGERVLHKIMSGKTSFEGDRVIPNLGGFKHNYQGLRMVDFIEKKYSFNGLNLTAPVREGMLKHTKLVRKSITYPDFNFEGLEYEKDCASTLEGQVVAICDEIAQRTHDLEDGIRAGLVKVTDVKKLKIIALVEKKIRPAFSPNSDDAVYMDQLMRGLINFFMDNLLEATLENIAGFQLRTQRLSNFDEELVYFNATIDPLQKELNKFIYGEIIHCSHQQWSDDIGEKLLFRLFEVYYFNPHLLPVYILKNEINANGKLDDLKNSITFPRLICDYIAGMTDSFAIRETMKIAKKNKMKIDDLKLESALGNDSDQI